MKKIVLFLFLFVLISSCKKESKITVNNGVDLLFLEEELGSSYFEAELTTYNIKEKIKYSSGVVLHLSDEPKITKDKRHLIINLFHDTKEHVFGVYDLQDKSKSKMVVTGIKNEDAFHNIYSDFFIDGDTLIYYNDQNKIYTTSIITGNTCLFKEFDGNIISFSIYPAKKILAVVIGEYGIKSIPDSTELNILNYENETIIKEINNIENVSDFSPDGSKVIFSNTKKTCIYSTVDNTIDSTSLKEFRSKDKCEFLDNTNVIVRFEGNWEDEPDILYQIDLDSKNKKEIYGDNTIITTFYVLN